MYHFGWVNLFQVPRLFKVKQWGHFPETGVVGLCMVRSKRKSEFWVHDPAYGTLLEYRLVSWLYIWEHVRLVHTLRRRGGAGCGKM